MLNFFNLVEECQFDIDYLYVMQESLNTLNLEYVETRKVSVFGRMIAILLIVILATTPLYEFIPQLQPVAECNHGIVGNCGCIVGW